MDRKTLKVPEDWYDEHNERRQELGLTWYEYIDGQRPEGVPTEERIRKIVAEELDKRL